MAKTNSFTLNVVYLIGARAKYERFIAKTYIADLVLQLTCAINRIEEYLEFGQSQFYH